MATVESRTRISIDELVNGSIISGAIDSSGHLILTTRGGSDIDAGFVIQPFGGPWSSSVPYKVGDIVGYAGTIWRCVTDNTNKPPALFNSMWSRLTGQSSEVWAERDPNFVGDSLSEANEFFWKNGLPTVEFTSVAGEFETGIKGLKINLPASASQRWYNKEENIVRDGEIITVTVRAKLLSAVAGVTLSAHLAQNDAGGKPEPLAVGAVFPSSLEGSQTPTTSWADYTWTMPCANAKPRAVVNLIAQSSAAGAAVVCVDRVIVSRASTKSLSSYPPGSIYITTDPTNPKTILGGGTWVAWGTGRVPVGVDGTQTEFDGVEETGGSKTVTLTEANLPPHDHAIDHNHASFNLSGGINYTSTTATGGTAMRVTDVGNLTGGGGSAASVPIDVPNFTGQSGNGDGTSAPVNNLPPYITVHMWKRTA